MKKFLSLILMAIAFLSCSSDNNNATGSGSGSLLTQLIFNYPNNDIYTKQYNYFNGNKLGSIVDSNGNYEYYTYEGDFITKIEYEFASNDQDERLFTYDDSGRLIEEIHKYYLNSNAQRTVFTYLPNGNVSYQSYSGSLTSQTVPSFHGLYTLNANDEILLVEDYSDTNSLVYRTLTSTFDDKNSPFVNVRDGSKDFKYILNGDNNVLTFNMMDSGYQVYSYSSDFTYNNAGYPLLEYKTDGTGGVTRIDFTYN